MVVEASAVPDVDKVAVCLLLECLIRSALVSKIFAIPLCPGPSTAGGDLGDAVTELKVCDWGFPGGASGKGSACQCRRHERREFAPWVGKIPGEGNGTPLQYSGLENSTVAGGLQSLGSQRVGHD